MWCAAVACCARGSCCVAVGSGPGLANVHCEWCQANKVAVGGNAGAARGCRRGQVNCGGSWGVRWPFVCSVRRCAECVCHGLDALCGNCAVVCRCGRPARLCSGVLSGALEHVKRRVVRMCFVCDAGRCWVATEVSKSARTSLIRAPWEYFSYEPHEGDPKATCWQWHKLPVYRAEYF